MKCATPLMAAVKSLAFMAESLGEAEEREREEPVFLWVKVFLFEI